MKTLYIVDLMNLVMRNYHAFAKHNLSNNLGMPTGALYGTCGFLMRLIEEKKPDYMVVAKESESKNSWRKAIYPGYKANREGAPEDMGEQLDEILRFLDILGIKHISVDGNEADDVIGALTAKFDEEARCFIVSGDKDFMQLVNRNTSLVIPKTKGQYLIAREAEVRQKFSCMPSQVQDILAIMGDKVDCVPGVTGIGEKGAAQLINEYDSLDGVYENLSRIKKSHREKLIKSKSDAEMSYKLVGLNRDLNLDIELDDIKMIGQLKDNAEAYSFCVKHNMDSLAEKYFPNICEWV